MRSHSRLCHPLRTWICFLGAGGGEGAAHWLALGVQLDSGVEAIRSRPPHAGKGETLGSCLEERPRDILPPPTLRRAAQSEGPGTGDAEHLLLLHVAETQVVPPGCQSRASGSLPPGCSDFKEARLSEAFIVLKD